MERKLDYCFCQTDATKTVVVYSSFTLREGMGGGLISEVVLILGLLKSTHI